MSPIEERARTATHGAEPGATANETIDPSPASVVDRPPSVTVDERAARAAVLRRVSGDYLIPAAALVVVVVLWEISFRILHVPKFIMPVPSDIVTGGGDLGLGWFRHIWVTLYETLAGFGLSILVGVPLAVVIVYSPFLRSALYPLIVLTQSVPKVAIAPVLLLMLGHGEFPKVLVAFLVAFFPVVVDTATGLAATPPELLDLTRSYRANALKTFWKVRFPMALPFFFSGLKVAVTLAVIGAVVGEFVGSDEGLGYVILAATSYWKTDVAFFAMGLLSLMAIVLFGAVSLVERLVCPWFTH